MRINQRLRFKGGVAAAAVVFRTAMHAVKVLLQPRDIPQKTARTASVALLLDVSLGVAGRVHFEVWACQ